MVELLGKVILSLPAIQSDLFEAQECYPYLIKVHLYYENWVK